MTMSNENATSASGTVPVPVPVPDSNEPSDNYYRTYLPLSVRTELEAAAYRSLCSHLRNRSDSVQNIDLMTVSGFCRNCLAKWLVVEARAMSSRLRASSKGMDDDDNDDDDDEAKRKRIAIVRALDALGYDEAAQEVYGCKYSEWKARHATKATAEQMEAYNASKFLHASHDEGLLKARGEKPERAYLSSLSSHLDVAATNDAACAISATGAKTERAGGGGGGLLSDVCCQDVDGLGTPISPVLVAAAATSSSSSSSAVAKNNTSKLTVPPPPPGQTRVRVGILTVSDRAATGMYETGDLGGPAVERALMETAEAMNAAAAAAAASAAGNEGGIGGAGGKGSKRRISIEVAQRAVVPDDIDEIGSRLKEWSSPSPAASVQVEKDKMKKEYTVINATACDLILTTGGTGFAPRDVTPEATVAILDRESRGLMPWISSECASRYMQPMASLSRATAGVRGKTVIANLPGNPAGAAQVVEVALPLLVRAVRDVQDE